jgi:hypothetical protein
MRLRPAPRILVPVLLALALAACSKGQRRDVTKVYPGPRLAALAQSEQGRTRYEATSGGSVEFSLADKGRRLAGTVPVDRGYLSVDSADLRSLEGRVRFDVTKLRVTESTLALEPDAVARALGAASPDPQHEWATFAITRVVSATSLRERRPEPRATASRRERDPSDEAAEAVANEHVSSVVVRGDLELHGFRAEREFALEVGFVFEDAGDTRRVSRVVVHTVTPVRLALAPFGIERSTLGATGKLLDSAQLSVNAPFLPAH